MTPSVLCAETFPLTHSCTHTTHTYTHRWEVTDARSGPLTSTQHAIVSEPVHTQTKARKEVVAGRVTER